MMMPSIFGENLFDDDWMDFPFDRFDREFWGRKNPLYGKHAKNMMKTDIREHEEGYELDIDLPGLSLIHIFLKTDMAAERARFEAAQNVDDDALKKKEKLFIVDETGLCSFALAIVLGIILAKIVIPLPGGAEFSLGTSGGPLIAGLILGHFGHVGNISLHVEKSRCV